MHVHVIHSDGEAKFWLEPEIKIAHNYNLSQAQLKEIEDLIKLHYDEFKNQWKRHLGG